MIVTPLLRDRVDQGPVAGGVQRDRDGAPHSFARPPLLELRTEQTPVRQATIAPFYAVRFAALMPTEGRVRCFGGRWPPFPRVRQQGNGAIAAPSSMPGAIRPLLEPGRIST